MQLSRADRLLPQAFQGVAGISAAAPFLACRANRAGAASFYSLLRRI